MSFYDIQIIGKDIPRFIYNLHKMHINILNMEMHEKEAIIKVSEEDFKLRGSGDIFGVRQSGSLIFKLADFKQDYDILKHAKIDAEEYYEKEEFQNNFLLKEILKKSDNLD